MKFLELKRPKLLKKFLCSENNFIVRVGLHLAVYYNASDLESEITTCIYHKNPVVRKLAYVAMGNLFLIEKADEMLKRYPEESKTNQTQIIISLGKIGNANHLGFLKNLLLESQWNEVEIASAIKSIDSNFLSDLARNNPRIDSLKKHTEEPLLK